MLCGCVNDWKPNSSSSPSHSPPRPASVPSVGSGTSCNSLPALSNSPSRDDALTITGHEHVPDDGDAFQHVRPFGEDFLPPVAGRVLGIDREDAVLRRVLVGLDVKRSLRGMTPETGRPFRQLEPLLVVLGGVAVANKLPSSPNPVLGHHEPTAIRRQRDGGPVLLRPARAKYFASLAGSPPSGLKKTRQ